jgi:hypothetical protein
VLLLIGEIYDIPFPTVYVDFLRRWFSWFELDFLKVVPLHSHSMLSRLIGMPLWLQFAKVECVQKMNFCE